MAWKQWSIATKSGVIAAGASLGTLAGQLAVPHDNSTSFVICAAIFLGLWAIHGAVMWALNRHRENHPGHETL